MFFAVTPDDGTAPFTYQWFTAPDVGGIPGVFTPIPGATDPTYDDFDFSNHWINVTVSNECSDVISDNVNVDAPAA